MKHNKLDCVDVGSEFCPCYLADTNDCITCSHLQGKEFCDCHWKGVCVYQEYVMNGNKSKNGREKFITNIEDKIDINDQCKIVKLKVTKTLARQLKEPGAYVFLRNISDETYYDVPMSIMDTDEINGYIYIAYQIVGTKTKKLDLATGKLMVRGPYWNGLFGIKYLKAVKNSHCLIVTKGIAQAPSVLVMKKLIKNGNKITLIVDKGRVEKIFIKDYIKGLDIKIIETNLDSLKEEQLVKDILNSQETSLVYSGGSDLLHDSIIKILDDLNIDPYLTATNNNDICCGEGVCGSCTVRLKDGSLVKTCKTQLDVREVIEGRISID